MAKLSQKMTAFVREYQKDRNAAASAIRAGYSPKGARQTGARLLTNVDIRSALLATGQKAEKLALVDRAWVLSRLRENVERAMCAAPVLDSKGKETGVYSYQGAVANKALELLGKDLGMFKDIVELQGTAEIQSGFTKVHDAFLAQQKRNEAEAAVQTKELN